MAMLLPISLSAVKGMAYTFTNKTAAILFTQKYENRIV